MTLERATSSSFFTLSLRLRRINQILPLPATLCMDIFFRFLRRFLKRNPKSGLAPQRISLSSPFNNVVVVYFVVSLKISCPRDCAETISAATEQTRVYEKSIDITGDILVSTVMNGIEVGILRAYVVADTYTPSGYIGVSLKVTVSET